MIASSSYELFDEPHLRIYLLELFQLGLISMLLCVIEDFNFTSYCGMLKSPISRSMTGFYITCETLEFSSKSCLNLSSWIFFEVWTCSSGCVKTNQSWPIFCHFLSLRYDLRCRFPWTIISVGPSERKNGFSCKKNPNLTCLLLALLFCVLAAENVTCQNKLKNWFG